jgi:hypothetical protein
VSKQGIFAKKLELAEAMGFSLFFEIFANATALAMQFIFVCAITCSA